MPDDSAPSHTRSMLSLSGVEGEEVGEAGETFAFLDEGEALAPGSATMTVPSSSSEQVAAPEADDEIVVPGYRLLRRLSRGGMGEVHLAERLSAAGVELRCAVKLVLAGKRDDALLQEQMLVEASIVAQLRHPNIVQVIDVGRAGPHLYLAMEWIDGCDLRALNRLARQQGLGLPLKHVVYIARETLQGLHHAHQARASDGRALHIVHRDISLGNVLVSRHGSVKLADFGVAVQGSGLSRLRLAGKPQYLAPELFRGQRASVQSDLYAMGVLLFELVTGEPLLPRNLPFQQMQQRALNLDLDQVLGADLSLPDGVEPIFRRSLARDPDARYGSALEMLEDVSDFAYESGLRLLDAHFARYVERLLEGGPAGEGG